MLSNKIVDTDAFLDMGTGSQLLYFHLVMRADDDGFVSNPKKIMRMIGSQEDDYKVLIAKRFILIFESGVCVIKHWLIHNLIRKDRYIETQWVKEKKLLSIKKPTNKYSLDKSNTGNVIPFGNHSATQVKLSKVKLSKDRENTLKKQLEKYINKYSPNMLKDFELYWTETNSKGKEKWQLQKTWDINLRLQRWKIQEEKYNHKNNQSFVKEEPKEVERKVGVHMADGFKSFEEITNN